MSLRILLFCTYFPPVNATGARRPYYLARQLHASGHRVTVVSSERSEEQPWPADISGIRSVLLPITAVPPGMGRFKRWLAHCDASHSGRWFHGPIRVLADLLLPLDHRARWNATPEQVATMVGEQDLVIATGPLWSCAEFGAYVAKAFNATFVVDYRDPWTVAIPEVHMDVVTHHGRGLAGSLRRARLRSAERRFTGAAYAITGVSEPVVANAQRITGVNKGAAFIGGFDPQHLLTPVVQNDRFTVVYTGRVYPEQDWKLLLDALERLHSEQKDLAGSLLIRLIGPVSTDAGLLARITEFGTRTGMIRSESRVSRAEAIAAQHQADAVLHLAYRNKKGYIPVKFLEYLNAGRPLILISQEKDEMERIATETCVGPIVPTANDLTDLLREKLTAWKNGQVWSQDPDRKKLQEYEYPTRMQAMVDQLITWHTERQQQDRGR